MPASLQLFSCRLPHQAAAVLGVDLEQFLFPVDIRLIDGLHPAAAQIVTAIAALTAAAAGGQALPDDLFALFPGGIPDQNRSHLCSPLIRPGSAYSPRKCRSPERDH